MGRRLSECSHGCVVVGSPGYIKVSRMRKAGLRVEPQGLQGLIGHEIQMGINTPLTLGVYTLW